MSLPYREDPEREAKLGVLRNDLLRITTPELEKALYVLLMLRRYANSVDVVWPVLKKMIEERQK